MVELIVFGRNNSFLIIGFSLIIIFGIVIYLIKNYKKLDMVQQICFSILISGSLGNSIDRIFRGYVIDYIDIREFFEFPIFNFADICIVCSVIIIAISFIIKEYKRQEK